MTATRTSGLHDVAPVIPVEGPLKFTWFNALNMSARICRFILSRILKFLLRFKSVVQLPGPRTAPFPRLPGLTAMRVFGSTGTATNAARFRYCTEQRAPTMQRLVSACCQLSSTVGPPA